MWTPISSKELKQVMKNKQERKLLFCSLWKIRREVTDETELLGVKKGFLFKAERDPAKPEQDVEFIGTAKIPAFYKYL